MCFKLTLMVNYMIYNMTMMSLYSKAQGFGYSLILILEYSILLYSTLLEIIYLIGIL